MNQLKKNRKPMRLKGYDYSQAGLYFITICTKNRSYLFGSVKNGKMILNSAGEIAKKYLLTIPDHFPHVKLNEYIIMPDHIHFIIEITVGVNNYLPGIKDNRFETKTKVETNSHFPEIKNKNNHLEIKLDNILSKQKRVNNYLPQHGTSKTVGSIVRGFKIGVTKWFIENTEKRTIWQRNYYDHIIHNENEYKRISNYIINNPKNW